MKQNSTRCIERTAETGSGVTRTCLASCRRILDRLAGARQAIFDEWRLAFKSQERALRLALNEAEAAAWQTVYPHLVFPTLAMEKVQAAAAWSAHQRRVLEASRANARAA